MSGGAAFLLVAVFLSVVGSVAFWWKQRKPKTFMSSIDEFQREMGALGHETPAPRTKDSDRITPIMPAPGPGDLARKLRDARRLAGEGDSPVARRDQER
jgi:hypothetical protein